MLNPKLALSWTPVIFSFHRVREPWDLGIERNLTNSADIFSRTSSPKNDGGLGRRVDL